MLRFALEFDARSVSAGGGRQFQGILRKIEKLCRRVSFPIGVKEVGWGIDGELVKTLFDCGVQFVDVAGAAGTSWSQVEKHRTTPLLKNAAQAFEIGEFRRRNV